MPAKKRNTEKKSGSSATADTDASLQNPSAGRRVFTPFKKFSLSFNFW
jgi:hypothetical protein